MTKQRNLGPAKKPPVVINVTDVAFGGDGIARQDGKVIFVEHAVPGETVEAELLQDKKRFARARPIRLLEPAADAVAAFCPVFGTCGGCDWQHVPYMKQLEWKSSFITSALFKNARYEHFQKIEVLPSDPIQNYRNRIKLKARLTPKNKIEFGFFAKNSHIPVFIDHCPIADQSINSFLKALKSHSFPEASWQGDVEVQVVTDGHRSISFSPSFPEAGLSSLRKAFPSDLFQASGCISFEYENGLHYATQAGQFQQVNVTGNHRLQAWIRAKVEELSCRTILDLFCGSGNLSLQLIDPTRQVWGLELAGKAIETAAVNIERNELKQGVYKSGPVKEIHSLFADLPYQLDCIITDPPRQGMDDSLEEVLALRPKHILSVSCDPNTFARDLKGILEQGYVVKELFGIDFFPHTYHVETIAHLALAETP